MNRRGFLLAAGAGLGAATISLPPPLLVRMNGSVLPAAHTPDPAAWSDNRITLAWLGHATVLINFYGVHVLTDPALFRRIGVDVRLTTLGPLRLTACALPATSSRAGATTTESAGRRSWKENSTRSRATCA